jgi:hypothetical protein
VLCNICWERTSGSVGVRRQEVRLWLNSLPDDVQYFLFFIYEYVQYFSLSLPVNGIVGSIKNTHTHTQRKTVSHQTLILTGETTPGRPTTPFLRASFRVFEGFFLSYLDLSWIDFFFLLRFDSVRSLQDFFDSGVSRFRLLSSHRCKPDALLNASFLFEFCFDSAC